MISILGLRACDGGDGIKIVADIDGVKNNFTVSADFYLENGIAKGVISEDVFLYIEAEDKQYAARRAALRILSPAQCSKRKLYEKLRMRGFPHECAKNASDFAAAHGYIDEDWQIRNYLKTLVEVKHVGRRKILPTLLAKGYGGDKICTVLDETYTEEDFKAAKRAFLIKKFGKTNPETAEEATEMKKALYKQGF